MALIPMLHQLDKEERDAPLPMQGCKALTSLNLAEVHDLQPASVCLRLLSWTLVLILRREVS